MPCWPLVATSVGFLIPTVVAMRRRFRLSARLSGALAVTSVLYHGTLHTWAHFWDRLYAHVLGILYLGITTRNAAALRRPVDAVQLGSALGVAWLYYGKSRVIQTDDSKYWHMALHIVAATSWTLFVCQHTVRDLIDE